MNRIELPGRAMISLEDPDDPAMVRAVLERSGMSGLRCRIATGREVG